MTGEDGMERIPTGGAGPKRKVLNNIYHEHKKQSTVLSLLIDLIFNHLVVQCGAGLLNNLTQEEQSRER